MYCTVQHMYTHSLRVQRIRMNATKQLLSHVQYLWDGLMSACVIKHLSINFYRRSLLRYLDPLVCARVHDQSMVSRLIEKTFHKMLENAVHLEMAQCVCHI